MFTRCLFCHRELPRNEELENFPVGRKIAFDPGRGRLWAVCPSCRRWNLAPIEERWEALEELQKLTRDRARLLSQTENISLLRAPGGTELVQVGRANLPEEAWWRYGLEMVRRRRTYQALSVAGGAVVAGALMGGAAAGVGVIGGWWFLARAARQLPKLTRRLKFGTTAWRGAATCPRCGATLDEIRFSDRRGIVASAEGDSGVSVRLGCLRCSWGGPGRDVFAWPARGRIEPPTDSGFLLTGTQAQHVMRRLLAYHNYSGGREAEVRDATRLIEEAGTANELTRHIARGGTRLGSLARTESIALEIAVNEDEERRLLELELAALEVRWREEEELAAIIDRELTWLPGPREA